MIPKQKIWQGSVQFVDGNSLTIVSRSEWHTPEEFLVLVAKNFPDRPILAETVKIEEIRR